MDIGVLSKNPTCSHDGLGAGRCHRSERPSASQQCIPVRSPHNYTAYHAGARKGTGTM